jgi:hypothetical protein
MPPRPIAQATTVGPIRITPLGIFAALNGSCLTNSRLILRGAIGPAFGAEF